MQADFSLDYDVLTVEHPQKLYLMARFEAGEGPDDALRRPLNLSLVIDRSGSMAGDKIDYTRQAAQFLIQHLGVNDIFSVVLYNDKVETLVVPEKVSNKDSISQLLDRIRVRGTTNLSGGWLEGCTHVANNLSESTLNRVILMSDGLANRGVTDANTLITMAKQKWGEKVSTTTMGLGADFNEDLMMDMAHAGGGAFYFIESPEVTPEIFQEELSGLLNIVGQNLTITLKTEGDVKTVRQLNAYSADVKDNSTSFRLGDIFANEVKTLVLELSIPAMASIGEAQIATLYFDYDEIVSGTSIHRTEEFPIKINVNADAQASQPNKTVVQSVLLLQAAQARRDAVRAADKGDYNKASSVLREVAQSIDESQVINNELNEEKEALLAQASKLEKGAEAYNDYSRKTMSTQSMYSMMNRHDATVMLRFREQKRDGNTGDDDKRNTMEYRRTEPNSASSIPLEKGIAPQYVKYKETFYSLDKDMMRIGRASHNELVIDEKGVSRFHGQITRKDGKVIYEDLGSTNGSRIEGNPLTSAYELSVGDVVYICDVKLVFHKHNN